MYVWISPAADEAEQWLTAPALLPCASGEGHVLVLVRDTSIRAQVINTIQLNFSALFTQRNTK